MNRRDLCRVAFYGATATLLPDVNEIGLWSEETGQSGTGAFRRFVHGNYNLEALVEGRTCTVSFSGRTDWSVEAILEISEGRIRLARKENEAMTVLKESTCSGGGPWKMRLLKQGNFFRYWVNDSSGWIEQPLCAWASDEPIRSCEPFSGYVGVSAEEGSVVSWKITGLSWLPFPEEPVIAPGPDGTFRENQILVGGVLEHRGTYYMYFTGDRFGCEEGAGVREIGVAYSTDLRHWTVEPEPILRVGDKTSWEPTGIYCSGVTTTPDGRIAVMYAAQNFPNWGGFGIAFADHPLGLFQKYEHNPVHKHPVAAHEFDLVQTGDSDRRYLFFYAGLTLSPQRGPAGDRGYLMYSNDLIHWHPHEQNPVFGPETLDNWDAVHVRPRSLNKIGDTWYLWYEGANHWQPPDSFHIDRVESRSWWDTVGLARSKDLVHWEYYPNNPALPGTGISKDHFDTLWVGWPRMFIKDGTGYVFYTGGRAIGLRTIPIRRLTNWQAL